MKLKLKTILLIGSLVLVNGLAFSQTNKDTLRLSLSEAVNLAVKQNQQLKSIQLDEEINKYKIKEIKAGALPQLTGNGSYNDNYSLASQILPGEVFGQPGTTLAVKFGTRHTYGATANLTQKLFDPSLNTGLKAAKAGQGYYELSTFKNKEDLIYNVVNVYMQLEMTEKQKELIEGNIGRMKKLVEITDAQFKEGIIKKVDVDQLKVNYTNLRTQLSTTKNTYTQLMNNLKILMNEDVYRPVAITNEVGAEPIPVSEQLFLKDNTDLALIDYQILLQELNTKNIKAGYMPSLSAFANYGKQWQTNELFKSGAANSFASGTWGLTLSIPIFDGFAKRNKIAQSNLQIKQLQINKQYLTGKITNDFVNAKNDLDQNKEVLSAQGENMKVAEELYNVAKLSYTEGITPLSELINAENGLKEAQTQYLTALLQMNLAELDLMKSSGQLSKVIKGN
jgi:outer membrane protein TolC